MKNFIINTVNKYNRLERNFDRPKTLEEALDLSIEKWRIIVEYYENSDNKKPLFDGGGSTCGLCQFCIVDCTHCPVLRKTTWENCKGTPYIVYAVYMVIPVATTNEKLLVYAQQELDFLKQIKDEFYG